MSNYYPGLAKLAISTQHVQNVVGRAAPNVSPERLAKFQKNMAEREARMHARSQQHQQAFAQNTQKGNFADALAHGDRADVASRTADASNVALQAAQQSQGPAPQHPQATPTAQPGQPAQPGTPWSWLDKAYGAGAAGLAAMAGLGHIADNPKFHEFVNAYREMTGHPGAHAAPAAAPHPAPAAAPAGQSMFANTHPAALVAGGLGIGALGLGAGSLLSGGGGARPRYPQQGYPQQGYPQQGYPQQGYPQQPYPPQYRYGR